MTITQRIAELDRLKSEIPLQAKLISKKNKSEILDFIRNDQLLKKGIDGKGNRLKEYSSYTIYIKKSKGDIFNKTTLHDTGSFTDKMDLIYTDKNALGIFSTDVKTPDLISKYGADIFTFTVKNNEKINEDIFLKHLIEWMFKRKAFTIT